MINFGLQTKKYKLKNLLIRRFKTNESASEIPQYGLRSRAAIGGKYVISMGCKLAVRVDLMKLAELISYAVVVQNYADVMRFLCFEKRL